MNSITKGGICILRPNEFTQLRKFVPVKNRIHLDTLLYTGMRYIETERFYSHPEWYEGAFIHLPKGAVLKEKIEQKDRYVRLNLAGENAVRHFLEGDPLPTRDMWDWFMKDWAKKAGLDYHGMCAKTTRKTWESWLTFTYGKDKWLNIIGSQGHNSDTSLNHYVNLPFLEEDKSEMMKYVKGWI